ncbi:MAG: hypothetical protein IJ520_03005 [Synergistaceae bacterium]|nr:hypothetical protein [Synergistaceae bacterium]
MDEDLESMIHVLNETLQTLAEFIGVYIAYKAYRNSKRDEKQETRGDAENDGQPKA